MRQVGPLKITDLALNTNESTLIREAAYSDLEANQEVKQDTGADSDMLTNGIGYNRNRIIWPEIGMEPEFRFWLNRTRMAFKKIVFIKFRPKSGEIQFLLPV